MLSSFQSECFCTVTTVERWALGRLWWFLPNVGKILIEDNFLSPTWVLMCWMQVFIARLMANGGAEGALNSWALLLPTTNAMQFLSYTEIYWTVLQYIKLLFPSTTAMQFLSYTTIYWTVLQYLTPVPLNHRNAIYYTVHIGIKYNNALQFITMEHSAVWFAD